MAHKPFTPEEKISILAGMSATDLLKQLRSAIVRMEGAEAMSDAWWEASGDITLAERELLKRLG